MYPRCPLSVQRLSLWDPSAFHYKGSPGRRVSCLVAKGKREAWGWVCGPETSRTETKEIPVAMCTPLYLKTFSELCKIDHRQVLLVCSLSPSSSSLPPLLSPSLPPFSFLFCPPFLFTSLFFSPSPLPSFFLLRHLFSYPSLFSPSSFLSSPPLPPPLSHLTTTGALPGGSLPLCCSAQLQTSFPLHCTCLLCLPTKTLLFP